MALFELLLGLYVRRVLKVSRSYARVRSLTLALEVIQGLRRVVLYQLYLIIGVIVLTASIFALIGKGGPAWDNPSYVLIGLIVVAAIAISWLSSEKRWLRAFKLDQALHHLVVDVAAAQRRKERPDRTTPPPPPMSSPGSINSPKGDADRRIAS